MKTKHLYKIFLLAALILSIQCKKDEESTLPPFDTIITQGIWVVSLYSESGINKTANYTGNTFKFNSGGSLTATKATDMFNGSWSVNGSLQTFSFTINTFDVMLIALNGDWKVTGATTNDLQFMDGNDLLSLHKQ